MEKNQGVAPDFYSVGVKISGFISKFAMYLNR